MLNVLSFFFILKSWKDYLTRWKNCFDAQCSELFLYKRLKMILMTECSLVSMLNVLSFFFIEKQRLKPLSTLLSFDAQFSELFLYDKGIKYFVKSTMKSFDAQGFELFLYIKRWRIKNLHLDGFDAQCFELFLYSTLYNCNE